MEHGFTPRAGEPQVNAGSEVAKPILAEVPGSRYGRRFRIAAGPLDGPGTIPSAISSPVSGTFRFEATTLRSTSGPVARTFRGPHMNTWLETLGERAT